MVLKDDNLGLGAKGLRHDQCTGLDAFQGLLDSLNGKAKGQPLRQEKIYQETQLAIYERLGKKSIRFVSGGFLEGTGQEQRVKPPVTRTGPISEQRLSEAKLHYRPAQNRFDCEYKAPQHTKSRKKIRLNSAESGLDELRTKGDGPRSVTDSAPEARRKRKPERKLKRTKNKELKRDAQVDMPDTLSTMSLEEPNHPPAMTPTKNHVDSQAGLPLGGRHAVRQKYIRHKKMAMMDLRAMNEVSQIVKVPGAYLYELTNDMVN